MALEGQTAKERLLNFFKSIEGRKILSGAFGGHVNSGGKEEFSSKETEEIFKLTSKYPAILAVDGGVGWLRSEPGKEADLVNCVHEYVLEYARAGGIISVGHTLPNPIYPGNKVGEEWTKLGFTTAITNEQYARLLEEGTPERLLLHRLYEKVAAGLEHYQQEGIPILYRPYVEANMPLFWWANSPGANLFQPDPVPDPERIRLFKALWKDLHHYLTNEKSVRNLIWIYAPSFYPPDLRLDFYPGDEYVDMIGLDTYLNDFKLLTGYEELINVEKLFAFAEVGPLPAKDLINLEIGPMDYTEMVNTILERFPKAVYFLPWNLQYSPITNLNAWGAYNNDRVLNRGDFTI